MKVLAKGIIMGLMVGAVTMASAQERNNTSRGNIGKSDHSGSNRNVTVQVESQPGKTVQANRSQVTYKREEPKTTTVRYSGRDDMKVVTHNNTEYYTENGVYYSRHNSNYVRIAPPAGLRITVLPAGNINIHIGNVNYFYFEGVYYLEHSAYYEVVQPPVGAIVYALPVDYEKVMVDGVLYYEYNGVLYERIHYNGERAYQVVGYIN